ncbi:hypothetical protein ACS5PU_20650 [Pedobacter sp. GSP4]|uniref:hypothetical protein n=1 Tax=Pedobacter sp. GSP4 TaxID=3453716 RepID=UPI003EEE0006
MKLEQIGERVKELIVLADRTLATKYRLYDSEYVSSEAFSEFRAASLSFLQSVFGIDHPFYKEFNHDVRDINPYMTEQGRGILKAIKGQIDGGWLFTVKSLVSAEIFTDFLEMAEYLLEEGYKDPSAVMIGSVMEEHLRQLCDRHKISVTVEKGGKQVPKKADTLNAELCAQDAYNKLDQKSITSWMDLRNKAAHGKYDDYTKEQVNLMYQGVVNFISRTS